MEFLSFITGIIGGNLLMEVLSETVADLSLTQAGRLWRHFSFDPRQVQKALAEAYRKTCGSLEIMLTTPETWREFFGDLLASRGEKEMAQAFGERFLEPFLRRNYPALAGRVPRFLRSCRKACRLLAEHSVEFTTLNLPLNRSRAGMSSPGSGARAVPAILESGSGRNRALGGASSRVTGEPAASFALLEALLFHEADLSGAPVLEEARAWAEAAIIGFLRRTGGKKLAGLFENENHLELFFSLLTDSRLFLGGLTFFLMQAVKADPHMAAIVGQLQTQAERLRAEQATTWQRQEHHDLMQRLDDLHREVQEMEARIVARQARHLPVEALQDDVTALRAAIAPLETQSVDLGRQADQARRWEVFRQEFAGQREVIARSLGAIGDCLAELGTRLAE
jgi:hypothetical protein